jgi:hypothetical protein
MTFDKWLETYGVHPDPDTRLAMRKAWDASREYVQDDATTVAHCPCCDGKCGR